MIIVSHRGPISFRKTPDGFTAVRGAGGVVTAFAPLLAGTGVAWVAAAIGDDDRAAARAGAAKAPEFELTLLDLDPETHRLHYEDISNALLWPTFHNLFDLVRRPAFDRASAAAWDAYVAVNESFAAAADKAAVTEGEVVLVHDYQLALVPGLLRARRPDLAISYFHHTPFCGPDGIGVLPARVATEICSSMASVPSGFHTHRWATRYQAAALEMLAAAQPPTAFTAPLGPDPEDLARVAAGTPAQAAAAALDDLVGDRALILRIDRMEPSKNIARGFAAYDLLLEAQPAWRERVVFVAYANPSREGLEEYRVYRDEVEAAAARVNDRWGRGDWQPVVMETRDDFPSSVAALGRYDVLVVNAVMDGLNLVAKEGPVLNRRDGVLCLSRGAGAFDELGPAAIEVHPFDLVQTAAALHEALSLPPGERRERALRLRTLAAARTPRLWLDDLVANSA